MRKYSTVFLFVGLLSVVLLGLAGQAEGTITGTKDHFETQPGTLWDFLGIPIPDGFFGPGSDPFEGQVAMQGVPAGSGDTTDTLVERLGEPDFSGLPTTPAIIPVEIVELHLLSVLPITVTYDGVEPELWHVRITLPSPDPGQSGFYELDAYAQNYGSSNDLTLRLEFESEDGLTTLTMDRAQNMLMQNEVDWSSMAPALYDFGESGGIFPGMGVDPVPQTLLYKGSEFSWGFRLAEVPEPASLGLLLVGGLALLRRRRK